MALLQIYILAPKSNSYISLNINSVLYKFVAIYIAALYCNLMCILK